MKKRSNTYRIFRIIATAICIPVVLLWMLIAMLYIPSMQRHAVDRVCREVSEASGFDIKINSFHLAFPLKLSIADFEVSRNDTIFAAGGNADMNISLTPLLRGEIEANYISLEKVAVNTANLIKGIKIDGKIGFFRTVARNIDFEREIANLRQIHIHSSDINITLDNYEKAEKNDSTSTGWAVILHRGNIENCDLNLNILESATHVNIDLSKLVVKQSVIDLSVERFSVNSIELKNTAIKYDHGEASKEVEPLNHMEFNDINLVCQNIGYSPDSARFELSRLSLYQPGGIRITDASAKLFADKEKILVEDFVVNSNNGSFIKSNATATWTAISGDNGSANAMLSLAINKKDLGALLTKEQLNSLGLFDNNMLKGTFAVKGNASYMNIDTIDINIPRIANLQAKGYAKNLNNIEQIEADIELKSQADDIRRAIAQVRDNTAPKATIKAGGKITYAKDRIATELNIMGLDGCIYTKASYNIPEKMYDAEVNIKDIDATRLFNDIPLNHFTGEIIAHGEGFDIFSEQTRYDIALSIDTAAYDSIKLNNIEIRANQSSNLSEIVLASNSDNLKFNIKADTELKNNFIANRTNIEISKADFMKLGITNAELGTKFNMSLEASTDMAESHALKFNGKNIEINTPDKNFTPAEIDFYFATTPDSSDITVKNGDLYIRGLMKSGYTTLFKSIDNVNRMFKRAIKEKYTLYNVQDYVKEIPDIDFEFECKKQNLLHNLMEINNIGIDEMVLTVLINNEKNVFNTGGKIYRFKTGEFHLDTISFYTQEWGKSIKYSLGVRSTAVNPLDEKQTFSSRIHGSIFKESITTNFHLRDRKEKDGINLSLKTFIKPEELDITFTKAIFFNNVFEFNEDNYIRLENNGTIAADVTFRDSTDVGMHLYTIPDEESEIKANLELFNIDLAELTSIVPYIPDISGTLNLDLFFNKSKDNIMLNSNIKIDSVAYEGTYIGNETVRISYLPKNAKTHYLDVALKHNNENVARLRGNYLDNGTEPKLNGDISFRHFPLGITKAFIKDSGISLDGYINGTLAAEGKLSELSTNGFVQFDSVYINAPVFGTSLRLSDKKVNIENNRIAFKEFDIYAKGDNPFNINGTVDFSKLTNPAFNLRMNANNYELINAPRTRGNILYGRMFIDLNASIGGRLNSMNVNGNATLLGKSNITYVIPDAPITTDKELDGLVEFVNFQDTTSIKEVEEDKHIGNMNIILGLKIEDGARINADLDVNRNSYVMLRGGGDLKMSYTSDNGLNVIGTYTMNDGELKYELPIIPLKTFNIIDGSKVTWNGNILDPNLEITAIERITTSVNLDDSGMQPVAFDVGVKISKSLSDMGLTFTISAPDNAIVQDQLNSLDAETLNKYAVAMLITGTYIGNTKGMTVSNALSSFIDAKINDLAGSAMKTVSINIGINDAENAETGNTYKNYSFSFKKRFWNDRLTIVIGGEVNSGDHPAANDSFINNVSLEWKISDNSNRYLRIFYDKNYESLLEGEIIETGIGYVYKKKLQNLRELFMFKKNKNKALTHRSSKKEKERNTQEGIAK